MSSQKEGKIGVFDSGFGGLSILKHIIKKIPEYSYVYFGDSKNAPYGTKRKKEILSFVKKNLKFMFDEGCELVIFACNTASSEVLRDIQQNFLPKKYPDKKVLGVIIPAVEKVLENKKIKNIGVMATPATVRSKAFFKEIKKREGDFHREVFELSCPLLVPLIEKGFKNTKSNEDVLKKYIDILNSKNIKNVILGCTHYELIQPFLEKVSENKIKFISEGGIVSVKLANYINRHKEIKKRLLRKKEVQFFSTGDIKHFNKFGTIFFGQKIKAKKVNI